MHPSIPRPSRPTPFIAAVMAILIVSLSCSFGSGGSRLRPSPTPEGETATAAPSPTVATPVAVITPDSQVTRLIAGVFAGESQPLPELVSDSPLSLGPNGLVTTDKNGEAQVVIQDCLKLFVFQATSLTRSTCRKSDAAAGLGVCGTQGFTGVINNCLSQVDIQSPSSNVVSQGTWFTVMYLPNDQMTIVQVFEDAVDVRAIIDPTTGEQTPGQTIPAGNLWFTAPGAAPPTIAGISGRTQQPMSVWAALRPELMKKYPNIDLWMNTASQQSQKEGLNFDSSLVHPTGTVILHFAGGAWQDPRLQQAMLAGVDWAGLTDSLWQGTTVTIQAIFPDRTVDDARSTPYNPDQANQLLAEAGYDYSARVQIMVADGNNNAITFADALTPALGEHKVAAQMVISSTAAIQKNALSAGSNTKSYLIWIETSGDAFKSNP